MQFSTAALIAASISMAAAWNVTGFSDSKCTNPTGFAIGEQDSIGCVWMNKPATALLVENLSGNLKFHAGSGTDCDDFIVFGGNGCYTQEQDFQSFTVF
ncbi:uncharacterized protein N7459_003098 [Penicillium hispanicum]|uniref:uncharacterized protein n=1 Tax=Penicillium hispanicum TaxID=1080232 RepID=UPI00253FCBCB|nr:uncharacterized protein N7459_003098 [Penicillium hispanicum]KAJ5587333.1 hypothetical protein N7459_003098 [Penicillium hispanicum]